MGKGRQDCRWLSEAEIAARALEGQSSAWDEIVRRHSHRVLLAMLARGVPWDAAHDLVQEVWVRLVRQQRAGRLQSLTLPGLAITQASWLAREEGRTRRRHETIMSGRAAAEITGDDVEHDPGVDPEEQAIRQDRLDRIRRELEVCPPRARQIFLAVYGPEGRSHAEAARDLGISVQRVRQALCEVRARMRTALREMDSGD
ncbi:MAG TPA: sigma-70 family RNA polymerase sigma factor [Candidatus Eisenbacteria bacterium]|nr:sigma-70 family RNA polymerase sigma factor [Candidatus Eisenbacteria bacterium]